MKLRFLIPFFALFFLLSCGDDPVSPEAENDNQSHGQEEGSKVVPDDENSDNENGNGGNSDSEHGSETCDDCDEDDEDVFEPEETDNTADDIVIRQLTLTQIRQIQAMIRIRRWNRMMQTRNLMTMPIAIPKTMTQTPNQAMTTPIPAAIPAKKRNWRSFCLTTAAKFTKR